ncbi:MAG TPA: tyrosine-type recombinase/integrase [Candidatus Saccharimonadales bacterium]|jgi:integrase|nr:tyrosine-type recombinase/integrase [Candidatus Saccharimonadales bacterium]
MVNGKEVRESTHETDETKAQKYLDERVRASKNDADGLAPFIPAKAARRSCKELLEAVKTNLESRGQLSAPNASNLKATIEYFGDVQARALTAKQVEEYKITRQAKGDAKATINRRLQFLRRAFNLAHKDGLIARVPRIELLDESDNVREGFFEEKDFYAVHGHLPEYLKPFAEFFYLTGMRPKEIKSLRWAQVKDDVITLRKADTKTKKKARQIPMRSPKLAAILATCRAARSFQNPDNTIGTSEFLFHRGGRQIGDTRKSWASACKAAKVSALLYDCRRTAIRNLDRAGVSRDVVKRISGHETDQMYTRYNITSTEDVAAAFAKVEGGAAVAQ